MADKTGIEWTEATWNPIVGCTHTSAGCDNCYAAREAAGRLRSLPQYQGLAVRRAGQPARFTGEVRFLPERLDQPLRWTRPRRVFVNSMSDLFHPSVSSEVIAQVFAVMRVASHHTFQILTKRAYRMAALLANDYCVDQGRPFTTLVADALEAMGHREACYDTWPLPNVWLGVSVESADTLRRVDYLRQTAAAVRWISAEPLLGPLDGLNLDRIDWVVAGGESGPGARPMHPAWVRDLRDRCAGWKRCPHPDPTTCSGEHCDCRPVAFLFKQWGEWAPANHHEPSRGQRVTVVHDGTGPAILERVGKRTAGRELDGRTWDEYPS